LTASRSLCGGRWLVHHSLKVLDPLKALAESRAQVLHQLAMNIEVEKPRITPSAIAEMVLSFFSGLCIEHNIKSGKASSSRKGKQFYGSPSESLIER
jgi:hypothetical protein